MKLNLIFILNVTFLSFVVHGEKRIYDCMVIKSNFKQLDDFLFNQTSWIIKGFNSFKELDFECAEKLSLDLIQIIPSENLILDNSLNMSVLNLNEDMKDLSAYLANFKGFDIKCDSNFHISSTIFTFFIIQYSQFDFYDEKTLINEANCYKYRHITHTSFLRHLNGLVFKNFNRYSKNICPFLFNNTNLRKFEIEFISNSYLNKNQFQFLNFNNTNADNFYINLRLVLIVMNYDDLTELVLNRLVFKNIERLRIEGYVYRFQPDMFKHFNILVKIFIKIFNLKNFFHDGNKWFDSLRYNQQNSDLKNILVITFRSPAETMIHITYNYPDEDFCLFSNFPHNKLVYPLIDPGEKVNCSCTIIWLIYQSLNFYKIKNTTRYIPNSDDNGFQSKVDGISLAYCLFISNYKQLFKSCNFDKRIKSCNRSEFDSINENYELTNELSSLNLFKLVEYIILIVLNPVFALIGIIINLLSIITIINLKNIVKEKQHHSHMNHNDSMFKHILINSIFNVVFCFTMLFKLFTECLFYTSSIYCPRFSFLLSTQSFKIIFIEYLGNMSKICCNVSYTCIALSRFNLLKSKNRGIFEKFEKFKLKNLFISFDSF